MFKKIRLTASILILSVFFSAMAGCKKNDVIKAVPELYVPMEGSEVIHENISYKIDLAEQVLPEYAEIYEFVEAPDNPETVLKDLADSFEMSAGAEMRTYPDYIIMSDNNFMIDYEISTGIWSFRDDSYDIHIGHTLPSDDDAVEIARNFLKERDLFNDRFTIETVVTQYTGSELDSSYSPYCKAVYFYPEIDGVPVLGVSRIIVNVGEAGYIFGVMNYYKDFNSAGKIQLAPPSDFTEGIKNGLYSTSISPYAESAVITDVKLAYWEDAGSREDQPYLQPVWVFHGTSMQRDASASSFDVIVQAAENVITRNEHTYYNETDTQGAVETPSFSGD